MSNGWSIEGALVKIPLSKTQAYNAPLGIFKLNIYNIPYDNVCIRWRAIVRVD